MTQPIGEKCEAPRRSVWEWHFRSADELRVAMEDYYEYDMAQGAPPPNPDATLDRRGRIYAQNKEIDRAMVFVGAASPYAYHILDGYYRRIGGLSRQRKGWVVVARALQTQGLRAPACPGPVRCALPGDDRHHLPLCPKGRECMAMWTTFEGHLSLCLAALFAAHERRWQRTG